jgi:predicted DNA-binding helix-hairpin-helix protein
MRYYGFDARELTTPLEPNLDPKIDPKLAWALRHRAFFPVDLNRAGKHRLYRVPGLGVRNVTRILKIRRFHRVTLDDLAKLRVPMRKVRPWVITTDFNPDALRLDRDDLREQIVRPDAQLDLFETATAARSGEL